MTCEHIQFTEYPSGIAYCHDCDHQWRVSKPAKVIDWDSREIYRVSAIDAKEMLERYDVSKRHTDSHGRTVCEAFNFGVSKPFLTITFTD